MSGRRARRCEVAKRAARVRLVVRLHTICPFVNVLVTYSLDYSIPPPRNCAQISANAHLKSGIARPSRRPLPARPLPRAFPRVPRRFEHLPQSARIARANSRRGNSAYHAPTRSERQLSRDLRDPPATPPPRCTARRATKAPLRTPPQSARTARANSRRDNSAYHTSARSERQLSRGPRIPPAAPSGRLGTIDMNVSTCIGWDSPWKPPRKR